MKLSIRESIIDLVLAVTYGTDVSSSIKEDEVMQCNNSEKLCKESRSL